MLKGVRKMDSYLTNWCKANGFDVQCKLGADFEYESETHTVYYALAIPYNHDELFSKVVCKPLLKRECNAFLLSLFHEIGHNQTEDDFDDSEMCDYYDFVEKLNNKKKLTKRDYKSYYFNDIEYAATKWGCSYINKHKRLVSELYEGFIPIVNNFYKVNKLEEI